MKDERPLEITTSVLVSYAYGLLMPDKAGRVKNALEEDETLRGVYAGIVQLIKDFPGEDPEELLEQMAADDKNKTEKISNTESKTTKPSSRKWLLAAAFIVLLAGGSIAIFYFIQQHSPQHLAAQMIADNAANPYSNATRGSLQKDEIVWKEKFIGNDFKTVISILADKKNKTDEEQFFLALSYLKSSPPQAEKAVPLLKPISVSGSEYASDSWLYLALAQTLEKNNKAALESISHIEQTPQVKDLAERLRR